MNILYSYLFASVVCVCMHALVCIQNTTIRLDWLASNAQGSILVHLSSAEITSLYHYPCIFCMGSCPLNV